MRILIAHTHTHTHTHLRMFMLSTNLDIYFYCHCHQRKQQHGVLIYKNNIITTHMGANSCQTQSNEPHTMGLLI